MPLHDLPETTSASQLGCYAQCGLKYYYRYVARVEPEYRSIGLSLGSAVHGAVAWWFDQRIADNEPTEVDASKVLHADLNAALAYSNVRWGDVTPAKLHAEAEALLRLFLSHYGELDVVETERVFELPPIIDPDTADVMPRKLIGVFDLVLRDGRVLELKTARAAYSAIACRTNIQFAAYRAAQRLFAPYDVGVIALIRNKTPRIQTVDLPADRSIATWFMRVAASIERAIAAGQFPPSPSAMCTSCEYSGRCLDGKEQADATQAQAQAA